MKEKVSADNRVREIRRKTRKKYSSEEKVRIVLEGLRGEESIAALAEFERELIRGRTLAGLKAAMAHRDISGSELCTQLGIKSVTLYRYVRPQGQKAFAT